jgi:hypothetical protein
MRVYTVLSKPLVAGALVLLGGIATGASDTAPTSRHQTAIVTFARPTWVASRMLMGTYVVVHYGKDMEEGVACTRIYQIGSRAQSLEEVVSFHCIPRNRNVVNAFTVTVDSNGADAADTLLEYQFAADPEGHGVPLLGPRSASLRTR